MVRDSKKTKARLLEELGAAMRRIAELEGGAGEVSPGRLSELEQSRATLELAMDQAGMAHWEMDLATNLFTFNERFYALYATSAEREGGMRMSAETYAREFVHPDERGVVGEEVRKALESGRADYSSHIEHRMIRRDGQVRHIAVRFRLMRDADGNPVKTIGANQDITEYKRVEAALRERERFINAVLEHLPIGIAVNSVDPEVAFSFMNGNFPRFYGTTRQALAEPDAFWEAVYEDPAFREKIRARILDDCASGDPERMQWRDVPLERAGRATRYVSARNIPIPDKQLMLSTVWDTTDRVRSQARLAASEERFRGLFENAAFGIALHDLVTGPDGQPRDYVLTDVNPAFERILGLRREDVVGRRGSDVYGVDEPPYLDRYAAVARGGEPAFFEAYFPPMGKHFQINVYSNRPGSFVTSFQDVTAVREAQQELSRVFAMSLDLICVADLKTMCFKRVNPAFTATLGFSEDELTGMPLMELVHPDDVEPTMAVVHEKLLAGDAVIDFENRYRCRDGAYRWLNWVSQPVPELGVTYAMARDVTEQKRVERELVGAKERAEAASRAKSEFLATMSHEIRTPLHGVMGMLNLMALTGLGPEQGDYLANALRSSRNLLRILSDILDISRIESGTMDLAPETFHLDEVVAPVAGAFEDEAQARGLALAVEVSPEARNWYAGDPGRVRQVLYNLLGNAVKYTEQGRVRLEVGAVGPADGDGARLHFAVVDTGVGIPEDKLDKVFDAFTQVDSSYRRRYGGTGLGLAIVKRLVHLMEGTLHISSAPGEGTEVHVVLPLGRRAGPVGEASGGEAGGPAVAGGEAPAGRGEGILVAEDDAVNQLAIKVQLEKLGYRCVCVGDGRAVLEALARDSFDLVLMDIQMPEMDGVEATRRIRAHASGRFAPDIPIIALTAHAMKGDREQFLDAGMNGYLSKPVDMDDLARSLRAALDAAGAD